MAAIAQAWLDAASKVLAASQDWHTVKGTSSDALKIREARLKAEAATDYLFKLCGYNMKKFKQAVAAAKEQQGVAVEPPEPRQGGWHNADEGEQDE